ncbi:MAG: TraB/GumN family protein [Candidatus Symbiothrix sp.]|jgi:uncharacterized protein YbaP (TraB family)|nr:TraB/GumN family protein [Candidatus Symbiothrix sp.]
MKTKKLLPFLLFLVAVNLWAQEKNYPSGALLWKISGKDLEKSSYILGTFHLKTGAYLDSIPGARAALNASEQVIGEVDLSNFAQMQQQVMPSMMMPADTTYHQLYSETDYQFVSEKIRTLLGAGLEQMGVLKPVAIQTAVSVIEYTKTIPGFNPENVLDIHIQAEAVKNQKPVLALETVDEQIYALVQSSSIQRQADQLLCYFKNGDEIIVKELNLFVESYNKGDLNALYSYFIGNDDDLCPSTQYEKNVLLKDRNGRWLKKLPALMKEKSSFIAVGAGHLAGEDGILYRLKQAGYAIDPVK